MRVYSEVSHVEFKGLYSKKLYVGLQSLTNELVE